MIQRIVLMGKVLPLRAGKYCRPWRNWNLYSWDEPVPHCLTRAFRPDIRPDFCSSMIGRVDREDEKQRRCKLFLKQANSLLPVIDVIQSDPPEWRLIWATHRATIEPHWVTLSHIFGSMDEFRRAFELYKTTGLIFFKNTNQIIRKTPTKSQPKKTIR